MSIFHLTTGFCYSYVLQSMSQNTASAILAETISSLVKQLLTLRVPFFSGRLRLNLNPLNLVRWIDSWPFDKTWKPGWIDSTRVNRFNGRAMNLEWIFIKTPSRARKSFSKASPYFFCKDRAGFDGDGFNAVRLFRVISEDSAERDSLDESSAFLIEGAQCSLSQLHKGM